MTREVAEVSSKILSTGYMELSRELRNIANSCEYGTRMETQPMIYDPARLVLCRAAEALEVLQHELEAARAERDKYIIALDAVVKNLDTCQDERDAAYDAATKETK